LNYAGATGRPAQVSGRVAAGPVWLSTSWTPQRPLEVAALARAGPVQAFASRQFGTITITPPGQWAVQLATRWADRRTVGRIGFGPIPSSAFSFPVTSLSY
jgi:hypothetical protein